MKMFFLLCFVFAPAWTLTLNEVKSFLDSVKNAQPDTLEIHMETTIKMQGQEFRTQTKSISLGKDKKWIRMTSSGGSQEILINGNIISVKTPDGKTSTLDKSSMGELPTTESEQDVFSEGSFSDPIEISANLYKIESLQMEDPKIVSREFHFNLDLKQVVLIKELRSRGEVIETTLEYCPDCTIKGHFQKMIVRSTVEGNSTVLETEVVKFSQNPVFPSKLFE